MNESVLVTGADGMIGSRLIDFLPCYGFSTIVANRKTCDLLDAKKTIDYFVSRKPKYVINCAGWNGGIGFNKQYPADIYYQNTVMALNVLRACHFAGVKKVVSTITSCAYPEAGSSRLIENNFHKGSPASSVECHGYARRTLDIYARQLFKQHGLIAVNVVLNNCYGPNDRFDPERSKFMAALIKKFCDAKRENKQEVVLWGSGRAKREVIYRDDAARALIHALSEYDDPCTPLNMGRGEDKSIKKYANFVAYATEFYGKIIWDTTKPDGQLRKLLDVSRMSRNTTFKPEVDLETGIYETVEWYNKNYDKLKK